MIGWGKAGTLALLVCAATLFSPDGLVAQEPTTPTAPLPADTLPTPREQPADTAAAESTRDRPTVSDPAADSIIAVLRELEGYVPTEYEADTAVYETRDGVLRLRGNAEVRREGEQLNADSIIYRDETQFVEAYGDPTVRGTQTQDLTGDVLYYDLRTRRATALGARTTIQESASWFVTGDFTAVGSDRLYASHAEFTTCDLEIPHYHFAASRVKVIRDRVIVAAPALLYFGNVPVMVLPFVVQSLEEGRRSGLLMPRFSLTDIVRNSSGYTRQISDIGYYWAINEYMGAQVSGTWRSGSYVQMVGDLDFNWRRQFLAGGFGFTRNWPSSGANSYGINSSASWRPDERTNLSLSANYHSSAEFVRGSTVDPREATQDLQSTLNINRRFDWGTVQLGSRLTKSISDGGISAEAPSFTLSPNPITLFRQSDPDRQRWYSNASISWGFTGSRSFTDGRADFERRVRDLTTTRLSGGLSQISIGPLALSATGSLNQQVIDELVGRDTGGSDVILPRTNSDDAEWNANIGYQIRLIGQTSITPGVGLSQPFRRDSLTGGEYLAGPRRMSLGASTSPAIFGFYPGVGPYSAIRHRVSTQVSYSYAPELKLSSAQERVFGVSQGYAQNRVSLGINQTWEAKLRDPRPVAEPVDTITAPGDSTGQPPAVTAPTEPQKVTILSISTSSFEYDFVRAAKEGTGWLTTNVSNTIGSDYLRGLSISMNHELFDRRDVDPNDPLQRGKLGTFAPRLTQLGTGFDLGPNSAVFRWLGVAGERNPVTQGEVLGAPPSDDPTTPGTPALTNNPQGFGGGAWRVGVRYAFSRPSRSFVQPGTIFQDRAVQTVAGDVSFALTPGWGLNWATEYSLTDREFSGHRLNFRRDLHRWEANFSFYQTPTGNTAFEFFVELIDNPDIKFDHRETDLGIDRQ